MADLTAIALIGHQKEAWAVEPLKKYAKLRGFRGGFARGALAEIGTSEALRALEQSLDPRGSVVANRHLLRLLQRHGDETSAKFLKDLSSDRRFPERQHTLINAAYRTIEKRLTGVSE